MAALGGAWWWYKRRQQQHHEGYKNDESELDDDDFAGDENAGIDDDDDVDTDDDDVDVDETDDEFIVPASAPATTAAILSSTSIPLLPTMRPVDGADYARTNDGMKPQRLSLFGRTHYYQIPANPKGTLAVFHGCARSAEANWPYSKECKECLGFPEDVANAKQALRKGYAFIALTPRDTKTLCWSGKTDFDDAGNVLERFLRANGLLKKPVYTMGSSSGGQIALNMQAHVEYAKLPFKISGVIDTVSTKIGVSPNTKNQPPVVWVVMSRGGKEKQAAEAQAAAAKKRGVAVAVVASPIKKVTEHFFSNRIPAISPAESRQIVAILVQSKLIDRQGTFLQNPKDFRAWVQQLRRGLPKLFSNRPGAMSLALRKSPVFQALLLAYSGHEHISEFTTAALEWFEAGARPNFAQLAEKHKVEIPAALTAV